MNTQEREIANIIREEISWNPTDGHNAGRAIERLAARERHMRSQEALDASFVRGATLCAKWAALIWILTVIWLVALLPKKPVPANVEEQLNDTIRPLGEQTWGATRTVFLAGARHHQYAIVMDTAKTPYYFNDSACLTHPGPQLVLSQKQYLDTVAAGTTLYVDSAKSNDSAWVYIFKATDTLIRVDTLPKTVNVNKL